MKKKISKGIRGSSVVRLSMDELLEMGQEMQRFQELMGFSQQPKPYNDSTEGFYRRVVRCYDGSLKGEGSWHFGAKAECDKFAREEQNGCALFAPVVNGEFPKGYAPEERRDIESLHSEFPDHPAVKKWWTDSGMEEITGMEAWLAEKGVDEYDPRVALMEYRSYKAENGLEVQAPEKEEHEKGDEFNFPKTPQEMVDLIKMIFPPSTPRAGMKERCKICGKEAAPGSGADGIHGGYCLKCFIEHGD